MFQPSEGRYLVEVSKDPERSRGGVIIPGVAQYQLASGKVLAVGKPAETTDGRVVHAEHPVGSEVLFLRKTGVDWEYKGGTYKILSVGEVLGRYTEAPDNRIGGEYVRHGDGPGFKDFVRDDKGRLIEVTHAFQKS